MERIVGESTHSSDPSDLAVGRDSTVFSKIFSAAAYGITSSLLKTCPIFRMNTTHKRLESSVVFSVFKSEELFHFWRPYPFARVRVPIKRPQSRRFESKRRPAFRTEKFFTKFY